MNALELLTRCRDADMDIKRIENCIAARRDALERVTVRYEPSDGGRGGGVSDKIGEMLAIIDELERKRARRADERVCEVAAALTLIEGLSEREAQVINGCYILGEPLALVARRLGYTDGYLRRIRARAEARLSEMQESEIAAMMPDWYWMRDVDTD